MSDDLELVSKKTLHKMAELYDRIEELERALEEIANGARDADKSYVSLFHELQSEARAALEKNND